MGLTNRAADAGLRVGVLVRVVDAQSGQAVTDALVDVGGNLRS